MTTIISDSGIQFNNSSILGNANFQNTIHNGNFGVNQRVVSGTVTLTAGAYGHDRWKAGAGGCTYTFATALNITTITISAGTLMQVIEGNNLQSGQHYLSWSGTAQGRVDSGTYGSSGLVIGTAVGGTNQTVEFNTGTLSRVSYTLGTVSSFENRPYGVELALCQRYLPAFKSSSAVDFISSGGMVISATTVSFVIPFIVTPRVPPTGILFSSSAHFTLNVTAGGGVPSIVTFSDAGFTAARVIATSSAMTAGQCAQLYFNTTAGYFYFTGCEL